jgi:DNA polymerase III subunit epsilon
VNLVQRFRLVLARRKSRWPLQARLLRKSLPTPGTPLAELEFVALELETTGPEPGRDELLAAGWVLMRGERIVMASARELRVRLRPPDGTGQETVALGPERNDLEDADDDNAVIGQLLPELAGRVIVMHDATRGQAFLDALLRRMNGVPMPNPCIGTARLEQRLTRSRGEAPGGLFSLEACRTRRGLPESRLDTAGPFAVACAELLLAQVSSLGGAERVKLRDLL